MANALPPSAFSSPTPERQAWGVVPPQLDDAHFRPHWSAVDPVERLFDGRLISASEKAAAGRFRLTYDAAFSSTLKAHSWDGAHAGKHCRRPAPLHSERQADALDRLARIRKAARQRVLCHGRDGANRGIALRRDRPADATVSENSSNARRSGNRRAGSGGVSGNGAVNGSAVPRPPAVVCVRFLRAFHHYLPRDVALVPRIEAAELVRQGVVEYADLEAVRRDPIVTDG